MHFVFLQSTRSLKKFVRKSIGNTFALRHCFPVGHVLLYWVKLSVGRLLLCVLHFDKDILLPVLTGSQLMGDQLKIMEL